MNIETTRTDVVIIGAGPVGLFAAFECGMLGLKCIVVDALPHVGGQCMALYPEKPIFDIPALPMVTAADLIANLMEQVAPFGPTILCSTEVSSFDKTDTGWCLVLTTGLHVECAAVIVAAGAGRLRPNKPEWTGLERFDGLNVFYSVTRKDRFRDRTVVITGGGDSAADWAVELAGIASKVYLIHRREKFRAAPETLQKIHRLAEQGAIELLAPAKVHALDGDGGVLQRMEVEIGGTRRWIDCDDALLFFGLTSDGSAYAQWGLETKGSEIQINAKTCATNLPGVYAVGDVATRPSKLKLILAGFSEAATAAHQAYAFCKPGEELFVEYSTARGMPQTS